MKFVGMLAAAVVGGLLFTGSADAAPAAAANGMSDIQSGISGSPMTPVACRTVRKRVCRPGRGCRSVTTRSCSPNRACRVTKTRDCKVRYGRRVCNTVTRRVCR